MDNPLLYQKQNATLGSCSEPLNTVYLVLNNIFHLFSIPITISVVVKLLIRLHKARSFLPAEVFLLQISFINVCLFVSYLMVFLDAMHVGQFSMTFFLFFHSPSLTVRPVFFFAICMIFYFAIVHPVTYMTAKTLRHWEWLVTTLGWLYALAINLAIIIYEIDIFQPIFMGVCYITILPSVICNIAQLRALLPIGSGIGGQTLSPAKRKALRIILSILVVLSLYYIPRVYLLLYSCIAPMDWPRFLCSEGMAIMLLSMFSELAMPVIFLYSLLNLGI